MSLLSLLKLSLISLVVAAPAHTPRSLFGPGVVPIGSAANYVILAQSGVSAVPTTKITGNVGLSPAAASFITGLSLVYSSGAPSSTSSSVTGLCYAADYADPTPANLRTAVGDSNTAYTTAAGLSNPDFTNLGAGEIGGLTLAPGLYKWTTSVQATTAVTISGSSASTWVFQIAGTLGIENGVKTLAGGALAQNIFWQVGKSATVGTTAHMEGIVSASTSVTLLTGASMNGRIFAQTQVALQQATLVAPSSPPVCPLLSIVILGIVVCL
ncbi:hypothetical protein RQP46_005086 [Phenoliferia psychrophenolica]